MTLFLQHGKTTVLFLYLGHWWDGVAHCDVTHPLTLLLLIMLDTGNDEQGECGTAPCTADTTRAYLGQYTADTANTHPGCGSDYRLSIKSAQNDDLSSVIMV